MRWLEIAEGEIGQKEIAGDADNPSIVKYHSFTTLHATDDETPWCSAFANYCIIAAGLEGTRLANARSWLKWGKPLNKPEIGCIVVLKRGNSPTAGHVGFCVGETATHIKLLGGNQADQVKVSQFPKSDVLGYRWPLGVENA